MLGVLQVTTSGLPSFSDGTEHLCEEGLGGEHLGEPLDEWQQEEIGHVRHEFVKLSPDGTANECAAWSCWS